MSSESLSTKLYVNHKTNPSSNHHHLTYLFHDKMSNDLHSKNLQDMCMHVYNVYIYKYIHTTTAISASSSASSSGSRGAQGTRSPYGSLVGPDSHWSLWLWWCWSAAPEKQRNKMVKKLCVCVCVLMSG